MSSDDRIGELLKLAGRRHMPDVAQISRAKAAARVEWRHVVAHRRWRLSLWAFGSAALVAMAVLAATWFRDGDARAPAAPPAEIAALHTVVGTLLVTRDGADLKPVLAGMRLHTGDRLETPIRSRAVFSFVGGTSVTLDHDSTAVLESAASLRLGRGALFVDAGSDGRDRDLHVVTPLGVVRHVGTQFEVRLQDRKLRVRVREGTIAVENTEGRWLSREGEGLLVASGRVPERHAILPSAAEWNWVNELAPAFTLEGATLGGFLQWISRHHGVRWQYANSELRARVEGVVLHGSIEGLTAEEALEAVLRTCGLTFRRNGEVLTIIRPPAK